MFVCLKPVTSTSSDAHCINLLKKIPLNTNKNLCARHTIFAGACHFCLLNQSEST